MEGRCVPCQVADVERARLRPSGYDGQPSPLVVPCDACVAKAGLPAVAPRKGGEGWWSQGESNPRPLECHSSALPTELWPRLARGVGTAAPEKLILLTVR